MDRKSVAVFLVKIVPLFALILMAWHSWGVSRFYHRLLSDVLSAVYPLFDPTGTVAGVVVDGNEFKFRLLVAGKRVTLGVNAIDITSNAAMLLAVYLASPVCRRVKRFLLFFSCSIFLLFITHLITMVTVSQEALMTHPGVMASAPFGPRQMHLVPRYNVFCEELGMYLYVLLFWFPYVLSCILDKRRHADAPADTAASGED